MVLMMTDRPAEARAEQALDHFLFSEWGETHPDRQEKIKIVADQIHQAEAAARRKVLEEAVTNLKRGIKYVHFGYCDECSVHIINWCIDEIHTLTDKSDD